MPKLNAKTVGHTGLRRVHRTVAVNARRPAFDLADDAQSAANTRPQKKVGGPSGCGFDFSVEA
jgi:hypothetical protein